MSHGVRIKKNEAVEKFFKQLNRNAWDATNEGMYNTADAIMTETVNNLRKGYKESTHGKDGGAFDRGLLAGSFRQVKRTVGKMTVGSRTPYAAHVEFGTGPAAGKKPYRPPPESTLGSWSRRHNKEEGEVLDSIMRFGTQPRRFLGRAVQTKKVILPEQIAESLAKALSEAAGKKIAVTKR
tara:strand:+ start:204 stop:746 length:543 start_codon:yes stop_codon:yes gene_type:complete